MKNSLYNLFSFIGEVTLIIFLVLGVVLIAAQFWGVFFNPELVLSANKALKQPAMYFAAISGFASLFCLYTKPNKK